jgi:hypothetical protein
MWISYPMMFVRWFRSSERVRRHIHGRLPFQSRQRTRFGSANSCRSKPSEEFGSGGSPAGRISTTRRGCRCPRPGHGLLSSQRLHRDELSREAAKLVPRFATTLRESVARPPNLRVAFYHALALAPYVTPIGMVADAVGRISAPRSCSPRSAPAEILVGPGRGGWMLRPGPVIPDVACLEGAVAEARD